MVFTISNLLAKTGVWIFTTLHSTIYNIFQGFRRERMEMEELIQSRIHSYYWNDDLNCAETTLKILAEIFSMEIQPQILAAAVGMHGAGKFGAQCGLVEGALMFIGILGKEKGIDKERTIALCYAFADGFEQRFKSLRCKDLRPMGFRPNDPPHLCEGKTRIAIKFSADFINKALEINP